jgi:3'-phosphoadenosine 5'-phosphosulfate sulfotransferase
MKLLGSRVLRRVVSLWHRSWWLERLEPNDAIGLGSNPDEMTYLTIGKIEESSEKAVRDAGSISVTVI